MKTARSLGKKRALLAVSALVCANIFLFGPFNIYSGNVEEFSVSLAPVLGILLVPAFMLTALLYAAGFSLPERRLRRYISVLFAIGLLLWVQGNILVWKFGLLDGQGFDWSKGTWRGWVDGALWAAVLAAAWIAYERVHRNAAFAVLALLAMQLVFVAVTSVQKPEIWKGKREIDKRPPAGVFEFSSGQNVLHIVLDGLQSDIFRELVGQDPGYYAKALDGFTFFQEATGVFPTTRVSVPAFLSGKAYGNGIPMPRFIKETFNGKNILTALHEKGFELDIVELPCGGGGKSFNERLSNIYSIPVPYGVTQARHEVYKSAFMLDLVLLRDAPYFLKRFVYNDGKWLVQRPLQEEKLHERYFTDTAFLGDLVDNLAVTRERPVYKYMHLFMTHPPLVVDKDCEYAGRELPGTRDNRINQYRCSLEQVFKLFDKLRSSGIYDSSLIVLNADHGAGVEASMTGEDANGLLSSIGEQTLSTIAGSALPFMAIKPPGSRGPMRVSEAQVSLTDLPDTISAALDLGEGFGGRDAYGVGADEQRERHFYYYKWLHENWQAEYFNHLDSFVINGSAYDVASWRVGPVVHKPGVSYKVDEIDFGTPQAFRFQRMGWGNSKKTKDGLSYNMAIGSASVFISLPKNKAVELSANVQSDPVEGGQQITVRVDGKEVGQWELSPPWAFEKRSVVIEPDGKRPDVSIVEFEASEQYDPAGPGEPVSVAFDSMAFEEVKPYIFGDTISFGETGNAYLYETSGWDEPEGESTLTDGEEASLFVQLQDEPPGPIVLEAEFRPSIVDGDVQEQRVVILINDREVGSWNVFAPGFQEMSTAVPRGVISDEDAVEITFRLSDTASPTGLAAGEDDQVLSLAFRSVKLLSD